jgi:hypothetical protein
MRCGANGSLQLGAFCAASVQAKIGIRADRSAILCMGMIRTHTQRQTDIGIHGRSLPESRHQIPWHFKLAFKV